MIAFCLNLILCFLAFLPAYFDHGKRKKAFKAAKSPRTKWKTGLEFIGINWGIPVMTFVLLIVAAMESATNDKQIEGLEKANTRASNTVEALSSDFNAATNRIAELLESNLQLKSRLDGTHLQLMTIQGRQGERSINREVFIRELQGKPKARVSILYPIDSSEAFNLAEQINLWLGVGVNEDGAGWEVFEFRPLKQEDSLPGWTGNVGAPLSVRAGALGEISLVFPELPLSESLFKADTAFGALNKALQAAGVSPSNFVPDSRLPPDLIKLIIGPKL